MPEQNLIERLDDLVEAILAGRQTAPVVDADLATLGAVAADLRDLSRPDFKARLRKKFAPEEETMSATATSVKEGFHTVTPYFVVDGADRFIEFMRQAFGARPRDRHLRPDGTVMHADVRIGDSMVELADYTQQYPVVTMGMHLYVDDVDAVYAQAVRAGATTLMGLTDQPYGDREASIADPFGNHWYIATHQATGSRPEGYSSITPFLHPRGADRLIEFVKEAFGATVLERHAGADGAIVHGAVRIGDSLLELSEAHGQWGPMPANIHLYVEDADAVYERAIAAGGTSLYRVADFPYGERGGGVTDPFGNNWFMATPK
ncbi:MAG: VOC family protein [Thermoanaerobaculia bacterium]